MTNWVNQTKNNAGGGNFMLLIDNTHFFLIDNIWKFLIEDGGVTVTWNNQVKN